MSYILDALRRADAERQQGGVPGLHTPASPQATAPAPQSRWLLWCGAAVLLMLFSALAWWWTRPALVAVTVLGAPATAPAAAPAPLIAPPPAAAAPLPIVVSAAPVTAAPPAAPASAAPPPLPPAPPPASVPLQQLAGELRRQLPPLVVGGSVWSDSAASRFVILDGQVTREGDSVAPGLVLERIQPKAAVLRWRDMRVEIAL